MKKLLLTTALVAIFGVASAQTDQGGWVVGGSGNLSFSSADDGSDDNLNEFNLDVRGGYFLMDNLAAGLNLGFYSFKRGDNDGSIFGVGPWARYYFNGTFYAGAGIDFDSYKAGDEDSVSGSLIKLEAGYPIFIGGETVALEPALNYWIGGGDLYDEGSSFALNGAFALSVGFFMYF